MVVISYAIARTNPIRSSLASMENHNLQGLWFICVKKEHTNIKSKLYYLSILRSLSPGFVGRMGSRSRRQMMSLAVRCWSCWGGCSLWLGCCGSAGQQKQIIFWLLPVPARCSSLCWYRCSFVLNSRCWELAFFCALAVGVVPSSRREEWQPEVRQFQTVTAKFNALFERERVRFVENWKFQGRGEKNQK